MRKYGLIGYPLSHSFSKNYFAEKFNKEQIEGCSYDLYPIPVIDEFPELIQRIGHDLKGLNVTIPHKQSVIPFLDKLDGAALEIGAVNTIQFNTSGTTGYNTDALGFEESLMEHMDKSVSHALILGNGGASKAVQFVLKKLGIDFQVVSRRRSPNAISYHEVGDELLKSSHLIVNTTPLGMFPLLEESPRINYDVLGPNHLLYDLIYNPSQTVFLTRGAAKSCKIINGLDMLYRQAEAAWKIWNS